MDAAPLTREEILCLARLREVLETPAAAKKLGASASSLLRVLAASPVHRGTVLLFRQTLAAMRMEASS